MPHGRASKQVIVEDTPFEFLDDITAPKVEELPEPIVVSVILLKSKIVKATGKVTGRVYLFNGSGSIVDDVDIRDAELMVNQPLPPSCCGSIPTPQFQIIGR